MTIAFDGQNNGQMTTPYPSNSHKHWVYFSKLFIVGTI